MAEDDVVSAPAIESRAVAAAHGVPVPAPSAGVPAASQLTGGLLAAAPKRSGGLKRFVGLLVLLGALGYGGKWGYDYFVEGRFLVSTDDAYVGASTAIIAAKATGHLPQVPLVEHQGV